MAQPNLVALAQGAAVLFEQLALLGNLPALDGGGAIIERLDALTERVDALADVINQTRTETRARDVNTLARFWNSTALRPNMTISPLVHPITGEAVPNFPATTTSLGALTEEQTSNILIALGQPDGGGAGEKKQRLKKFIGMPHND